MFDYLKAEAYHELRRKIMNEINKVLAEDIEYRRSSYHYGRYSAVSEVLHIMNTVDNELNEEMKRESEKVAAYYEAEHATDDSRSDQL